MGRQARVRHEDERGAAALEFALVVPILLVIVFGIINYGLVFNDSNNARAGTREAVRRAVVLDFGGGNGTTAKLVTNTKTAVGALSGTPYVKVVAPATWTKGAALTVCVVIKPVNLTGLVPMPKSISSVTSMSVESVTPAPTVSSSADPLPTGLSWPAAC